MCRCCFSARGLPVPLGTGSGFVPLPAAAAAARQGTLGRRCFCCPRHCTPRSHLLTAWKEAQSGTLEWRQTCQISLRTMTALRMLVFGSVSVLVCVPANLVLWYLAQGGVSLSWMVALSVSSLCLYGALSLYCLRLRGMAGLLAAPAIWTALGIVPLLWERAAGGSTECPPCCSVC